MNGLVGIPGGLIGVNKKGSAAKTLEEREADLMLAFKRYLDSKDPDVSNFKFNDIQVLLKIFFYREQQSALLKQADGSVFSKDIYFPIAKVLASGDKSVYNPGDYVKLSDFEVCEVANPSYELWTKNNLDNGSQNKIGEAPPATISNFKSIHGKKVFILNPIRTIVDLSESNLYIMFDPHIVCKIDDPQKFING